MFLKNYFSDTVKLIMVICSRFSLNMAVNIGFQYAAELLPTVVRVQGFSVIHIAGFVFHVLAPYLTYIVSNFYKN